MRARPCCGWRKAVTAAVALRRLRACVRRHRATSSFAGALFAAAPVFAPSPATAQASGAISIFTDDRYRGASLSDGRPVAILDFAYDAPSGFYGALTGKAATTRDEGLRPLGLIVN